MNLLIKSQMLYQLSYWPVCSEYTKHVKVLAIKTCFVPTTKRLLRFSTLAVKEKNRHVSTLPHTRPAAEEMSLQKFHNRYFTPSQEARA